MSACSSSTAPSVSAGAAMTASTYAPAIGGDAETGVQAISQDTVYDPTAPADQAGGLAAMLQQAQSLLAGMMDGAGNTASGDAAAQPITAPGTGDFSAALGERSAIQLRPMRDGAAAIANLDMIVDAREQRIARLEEAFLSDPDATPADQARLDAERQLLRDTKALRDKLASLAQTIDQNEAAAILQLVGSANQRGSYQPEHLAELMIQIEGSANDLPASYLEKAMQAQELLEQTRADMDALMQQVADAANANGGVIDQQALVALREMAENQEAAQEALHANFELAKRDPAQAQAQLEQLAA